MKITDVPQSGQYFQRGAIVQLVVQLIDDNSGDPIPLQSAVNTQISILYPDLSTTRIFNASLYTDGSDGRIAYITKNNSQGYSDLNQIGLYQMQGQATIGGIPLPPSAESNADFYVLPNVFDQAVVPIYFPVMIDNVGNYWKLSVDPTNHLVTTATNPSSLAVSVIYMQDSTGQVWAVTILAPNGNLDTNKINTPVPANAQIYLVNTLRQQVVVTVQNQPSGNLVTN